MRIISIILFLQFFGGAIFAQSDHDPRLIESHDIEYLDRLKTKSPAYYQRLDFYLDHSFYIGDYDKEKFGKDIPSINILDINDINIYIVKKRNNINNDRLKQIPYRIEGTDKVLILESMTRFNKAFNKSRSAK